MADSAQLELDDPLTFVSYAKEDRAKALKLYGQLRDLNLRPWLDQHHLSPGQHWELTIRRAIRRCRFFLVLLSQRSVNKKGFVQSEIRQALRIAEEQPEGRVFIVPLRIEDCEVPDGLSHLQWIDVFKPGGRRKLLDALIANLGDEYAPPKPASLRPLQPLKGLPPLDQLVTDLIIRSEHLVYGDAGAARYCVSDGRFLVVYKSEPRFIKQLKNIVPSHRQLSSDALRRNLPPRSKYRTDEGKVHTLSLGRRHDRSVVELHTAAKKRTAMVDNRFWRLTAVICPEPEFYIASDDAPVIVDDGKSFRMVIMPIAR